MKKLYGTLLAMLFACATLNANAENVAVGVKAGSLGFGLEISAPLQVVDNLNGRLGFNYFSHDQDDELDDIDYDTEATLNTLSALLDWHPMGNGFRVSGGLFYNKSDLSIESTTTGLVDIGGTSFPISASDKLKGDAEFDPIAPYLGIGYGHYFGNNGNLSLTADLGVMFQGEPDVSLSAEGALATAPGIQAALQQEEDDIQDDADEFEYFPVISVGLSYRF